MAETVETRDKPSTAREIARRFFKHENAVLGLILVIIIVALAAMTRPEGLLVYALTGVHQVASRLICERKLATRQDWRRLGLFALIWVPWFGFRWRYYGYPLPNTFYAKVTLGDDEFDAELVGSAQDQDLAVLRISAPRETPNC